MKKLNPALQAQEDTLINQIKLLNQLKVPFLIDKSIYSSGIVTKQRFFFRLIKEGIDEVNVLFLNGKAKEETTLYYSTGRKTTLRKTIAGIHEFFDRTNSRKYHK